MDLPMHYEPFTKENLYAYKIYDLSSKIENHLNDIVTTYRKENLVYI
jgi:hypothetical protein